MRLMKWIGIAAASALVGACFTVWVYIASKNISVTGVETAGTRFGKPGYLHFVLIFFFVVFSLVPRIWAKRFNLLVAALNLAWATRNYFTITACSGGECPEKKIGIYIVLLASVVMLAAALLPDIRLKDEMKQP